jgi:hypothetical protein
MPFISFDAPASHDDRTVGRERPPGRHLAEALARAVEAARYDIVEPLDQHDSYGWAFTVRTSDGKPVWCMLQLSDEWLLITHAPVSWLQKLRGATDFSSEHARLDTMLMGVLSSMPQVSNVRWFRAEEDFRADRPGEP